MKNNLNNNTRKLALEYLKAIQLDGLKKRFGKRYLEGLAEAKKIKGNLNKMLTNVDLNKEEEKELKFYNNNLPQKYIVLATEYELFSSSHILAVGAEEIEKAIKRLKYKVRSKVFFGVASSGLHNAYAETIPEVDAYLIIIEDEIFTLCNMLSKIIVQGLPGLDMEDEKVSFSFKPAVMKKHIENSKELQDRFNDLVVWGILGGKPTHTQQYYLEESLWSLQQMLFESAELFIVGHEYGHILAAHLDSALRNEVYAKDKQFEIIVPSWADEYEADKMGLELMCNSVKLDPFTFSFLGAELFSTFLDLDERVLSFYYDKGEKRDAGSNTHPPTIERKRLVNYLMINTLH